MVALMWRFRRVHGTNEKEVWPLLDVTQKIYHGQSTVKGQSGKERSGVVRLLVRTFDGFF